METKEQRTTHHTEGSAFFHVAVSEVVFTGGFDAGNGEDEEKLSSSKSLRLIGKINDRMGCPQIHGLTCEVNFVIDDIQRFRIQNPPRDSIIGQAVYCHFAEADQLAVSILCTSEYFRRVEEIAMPMVSSVRGEAWLSIGVLDFPQDWRPADAKLWGPADSKLGKSSFWVTSAELQWRAEVGRQNTS